MYCACLDAAKLRATSCLQHRLELAAEQLACSMNTMDRACRAHLQLVVHR